MLTCRVRLEMLAIPIISSLATKAFMRQFTTTTAVTVDKPAGVRLKEPCYKMFWLYLKQQLDRPRSNPKTARPSLSNSR